MTTVAPIARIGAPVRAVSVADVIHTPRGHVEFLPDVAPVAIVRWHCGCRSYVPLRRLVEDTGTPVPACEFSRCTQPRWDGPYCPAHRSPASRTASPPDEGAGHVEPSGESFEPTAPRTPAPARSAAIDDAGTTSGGGLRGPAAVHRAEPTPSARPSAPRPPRAGGSRGPAAYWTRERVIAAIQLWAAGHGGEPPRTKDWNHACPNRSHPQFKSVFNIFGSWSAGLVAAGFTPRTPGGRQLTDQDIIDAMHRWVAQYGAPPAAADWSPSRARKIGDQHRVERYYAGGWPSFGVVVNHFGSWTAGLRAAGLEPHPMGRRPARDA